MMKTMLMTIGFVVAFGTIGFGVKGHFDFEAKKEREAKMALLDLRAAIEVDVGRTIGAAKMVLLVYDAGGFSENVREVLPSREEIAQLTEFPNILDESEDVDYLKWKRGADEAALRIHRLSQGVAVRLDAALASLP
jgi:hypothetical protein